MTWTKEKIHDLVESQRDFFLSNQTLDVNWRIDQLARLKLAILANEKELEEAMGKDLGRTKEEAYLIDIGPSLMAISEMIAGIKKWAKPETHFSGMTCFPSVLTKVYKMPYGVSLIISPFNFPILLTFGVLAASISAGNTAVLKVSSKSVNCTKVIQKIISTSFPEN